MTIISASMKLNTKGNTDIIDITGELEHLLTETGLSSGTLTVFCPSSTSALTTVEFESGAISDLKRVLDELIPTTRDYNHNSTWGDGNGASHMRASLLGPSLTIPFIDKTLTLGTWQQVIYLDFDNRPRQRELVVQIMGE